MFTWKNKTYRDKQFRVIYAVQLLAVITVLVALFVDWYQGGGTGSGSTNAFGLMRRSLDKVIDRSPHVLAEPLGVLWLLWPSLIVSGTRSFTGVLVQPIEYFRLALVAWGIAALVLAHFYINFGNESLASASAPLEGSVEIGFWVAAVATALLGVLLLLEIPLRREHDTFMPRQPARGPVSDAERLWKGDYLTCPYCGMLNEPGSKTCYNCHNLLFDFRDEE